MYPASIPTLLPKLKAHSTFECMIWRILFLVSSCGDQGADCRWSEGEVRRYRKHQLALQAEREADSPRWALHIESTDQMTLPPPYL